ncbi:MAG: hypothetical protein M3A44_01905 [Gammaproteobacteria bacterium]
MNKILIGAAAMAMVASFGVFAVANAGDKEAEAAGIVAVERDGHDTKGHNKHADMSKMDKHAAKAEGNKERKKEDDRNIPK